MQWPLKDTTPLLPDEPGSFGVFRKADRHTGVDLYCERGTEVVAMEAGTVGTVEDFTGANAESPWWNDTQAILVAGKTGVIVYGEVRSLVKVGQKVKAGEVIAIVEDAVLKSFKGRPMVMLHIELMALGCIETLWWELKDKQNIFLEDPTDMLLDAAGDAATFFRMEGYDGKAFIDSDAPRKASPWWGFWGGTP